MGNQWSQLYPPAAQLTEKNLPDQAGKVFIVTGSSTGVGKELAQILYSHNAKVYIAARSQEKATRAIESIKTANPKSSGDLVFLHLDLDDLTTIKKSAEEFLNKEKKLDVLWNNAGVMIPPQGSKTKQGYELQLGTNNVAPFLFTKLLTPILAATAKASGTGAVRVVWVSSSAAESFAPTNGVDMGNLDYKNDKSAWHKYGVSKGGNVLHGLEYAKRHGGDGIVSVSLNPGNLKTDLQRHVPGWQLMMFNLLLYTPIHGAYTELFAGLSPEVTPDKNGAWIVPWGRFMPVRKDLVASSKTKAEGGTGTAADFWEWTEEQVKPYL
ncbi:Short-chain dehydrogenase reductase [Hyphodiscus hymeniophilus]|uniref:Short-chain dehydrogenase reductase n=1 Tax=Hyphodiscus hymeniophilus TaxID=353542 RepID=A0A9P6VT41_9HELO|nr:Short-chain dehydrogenase reductase [Hyphodiscus hymeniophilus]